MSGARLDRTITLCGSLSRHPVSLGAAMHRAGYAALGLDFEYVPFATSDLGAALVGMRALGVRGLGVSMPFKIDVLPLLDEITPIAAAIGAVNTIVNEGGRLVGHNTDAYGAVRALEELGALAGRRAVVVGAGGAARAVVFALAEVCASVHVVNRTVERARALAERAGASHGPLGDLDVAGRFDVVVNASSAGMAEYGAASPVPVAALGPGVMVLDAVYKPIETALVREARSRGATVAHGGRMLLHQACRQFELYTGEPAPVLAMDAALRARIGG